MKFGIASYHRPECKAVKTLLNYGICREDIIISTQTQEDYEEYKNKHDVEVIYSDKDCAGGNRNTILQTLQEPVVLLDDDITNFSAYDGQSFKIADIVLKDEIDKMIVICNKNKVAVAGISPSTNAIVRKGRAEVDFLALLQGTFLLVIDTDIRFNEKWKMVEDYELALNVISSGKNTARFNDLCANKPKNGSNKGGMHERYERGELKYWIEKLHKVYPIFKPNKTLTGGSIKF